MHKTTGESSYVGMDKKSLRNHQLLFTVNFMKETF